MTIDEAIKMLGYITGRQYIKDTEEADQAIKLGIEALKRYKFHARRRMYYNEPLLPSETEE